VSRTCIYSSPSPRDKPADILKKRSQSGAAYRANYHGVLTDHLSYPVAQKLILHLLQTEAEALGRVAMSLHFQGMLWKGLPPGATGALSLLDSVLYDGWEEKRERFYIEAWLQVAGSDPEDEPIRQSLREVRVQTQLPFDEGELYARPDPVEPVEVEPFTVEERLPADVGFQEAVAQTAIEIASSERGPAPPAWPDSEPAHNGFLLEAACLPRRLERNYAHARLVPGAVSGMDVGCGT
jgi:hypothetical protein